MLLSYKVIILNIGKLLYEIRKERNLTLKEVADNIGISISLLSQYERNEVDPPFSKIYALLDFYNLNCMNFIKNGEEYICITHYSKINKLKVLEIDRIECLKRIK